MYPDWVGPAVAGFLAVWLLVLTFLVWRQKGFLKSLFPRSGERDIRVKFEEVVKEVENFRSGLDGLKQELANVRSEGLEHIQRIELLRFNPFDDTGGNISFAIALLNKKGDGFVLTSLHARAGTRVFAKEVLEGRATKSEFSKEEEQVVRRAMKQQF